MTLKNICISYKIANLRIVLNTATWKHFFLRLIARVFRVLDFSFLLCSLSLSPFRETTIKAVSGDGVPRKKNGC